MSDQLDPHGLDVLTEAWMEMGTVCDQLESSGWGKDHRHLGQPEDEFDVMCYLCVAEHRAKYVRKALEWLLTVLPLEMQEHIRVLTVEDWKRTASSDDEVPV